MDISNYTIEKLEELSGEIRERIIDVVSKNGGHLSSTIGAVELIVAMHHVFNSQNDPFIFDVSHQAYAHKLLTDRWESFETLRQLDGICGFTKSHESPYDYFVSGHSSTSISLAVGAAKAIHLKEEQRIPIALIGDGSMSSGMVYEALNELGDRKYPVIIILNDNEMSIAKPIGAISKYLSQKMASPFYQKIKHKTEQMLEHLPEGATYMAKKFEESLKLITPGIFFEELGLEYIGPVDGHDLESLIDTFQIAKELHKPVVIHAQTLKGKGYKIAEGHYEHWHGVGPFDIDSGKPLKKSSAKSATAIFSDALLELAREDEKVVGVTAAMPGGTGIMPLIDEFPKRFWDVAIAEQHAVTSMAAMAKEGFKPFIAIYSTFLQRGYDQIIHDCAIEKMPVVFAIDRAGIVGEDGETHQGAFDISYLRIIPNLILFAPRDETSLIDAVRFANRVDHPCAFRYPRGAFYDTGAYPYQEFTLGKGQLLKEGESNTLLIGYGNGVGKAIAAQSKLKRDCALLDLRFVKPLDKELLRNLAIRYTTWHIISDSAKLGGVASAISEFLAEEKITRITVVSHEYSDRFIEHGNTKLVEDRLGVSVDKIVEKIEAE
jgi:1-deoxy-D-xylulose-5-phosphate synthase